MRKWTSVIPVLASYGLSAAVYSRIPPQSFPDFSSLLPFSLGGSGAISRDAVAWLMPTIALGMWLFLNALARVRGPAKGVPGWLLNERVDASAILRFEPTFNTVIFSVAALVALMHIALVGSAIGWPRATLRVITVLFGLGLIAAGNVMPRVKPNWIVGLRTKRTLGSPAAWARAHRILGAMMMGAGTLVIALSVAAPRYAIVGGLAAMLLSFPAAYLVGAREPNPDGIRNLKDPL